LTPPQRWGVVAAAAFTSTHGRLRERLLALAREAAGEDVLADAAGAATVMGMTNVYYRFLTLVGRPEYQQMAPGIHMTRLKNGQSGAGHMDLFALAVSVINGCGTCIKSHEAQLTDSLGAEAVHGAVRLAAAVNGLAHADRATGGSNAPARTGRSDVALQPVHTASAPEAIGPYSQAMVSDGLVFASGQIGSNPATGQLAAGAAAQTGQALANLGHVLSAAGARPVDVLRATVYITDLSDFDAVNDAYTGFFGDHRPARILVEVAGLPRDALVEVAAVARQPLSTLPPNHPKEP
ncbi:MAG: Rid family detoxifying hydrolase, partial [Dermatophilaceae bacterium]